MKNNLYLFIISFAYLCLLGKVEITVTGSILMCYLYLLFNALIIEALKI